MRKVLTVFGIHASSSVEESPNSDQKHVIHLSALTPKPAVYLLGYDSGVDRSNDPSVKIWSETCPEWYYPIMLWVFLFFPPTCTFSSFLTPMWTFSVFSLRRLQRGTKMLATSCAWPCLIENASSFLGKHGGVDPRRWKPTGSPSMRY